MVLANLDCYFCMDLHSYGDGGRVKAFYNQAGDIKHSFNLDRAHKVFAHTQNLIDGVNVTWYNAFDSEGWGPGWGAHTLGLYAPNLECGNALADGVRYSSGALTSDFYDFVGFLMFD